jgi:hypothetical protein
MTPFVATISQTLILLDSQINHRAQADFTPSFCRDGRLTLGVHIITALGTLKPLSVFFACQPETNVLTGLLIFSLYTSGLGR